MDDSGIERARQGVKRAIAAPIGLAPRAGSGWRTGFVAVSLLVAVSLSGCYPTYAPPMRMGLGRLPEALGKGRGAVQVSYAHPYVPVTEGRFAVGLTPTLDLDAGLFWMLAGVEGLGSLMGSTALHWEVARAGFFRMRLTGGVGVGRGGEYHDPETDERTDPSFALGALAGLDLGFRISRYFGIYVGNRYNFSVTPQTPATHWGYHTLGLYGQVAGFYLAAESGFAYYANHMDSAFGPTIIHVTFGYRFSMFDSAPDVGLAQE